MPDISKAALRKQMLEKRNALSESKRKENSEKIKNSLFALPEVQRARCIAFYITKGSEVDTRSMINEALAQGKTVLVPVTNEDIELVTFTSWADLKPGKFGILEPPGSKPNAQSPDILFVPGIAFNVRGFRIGYGKGYYDRLLKKLSAVRIGICFEAQILAAIPVTPTDEKMDFVITEKRLIPHGKSRKS